MPDVNIHNKILDQNNQLYQCGWETTCTVNVQVQVNGNCLACHFPKFKPSVYHMIYNTPHTMDFIRQHFKVCINRMLCGFTPRC